MSIKALAFCSIKFVYAAGRDVLNNTPFLRHDQRVAKIGPNAQRRSVFWRGIRPTVNYWAGASSNCQLKQKMGSPEKGP